MDFTGHPFGIPSSLPNSEVINAILKASYSYQKRFRLTNACAIINLVLKRCFDSIGVQVVFKYGVLDSGTGIALPHLWLDYKGKIIDNTFVEDIEETMFIFLKQNSKYIDEEVSDRSDLYMGDHVTRSHGIDDHNVDQFRLHLRKPDNSLTIGCRNKLQIGQYCNQMRKLMKEKHNVTLKDFSNTGADKIHCWTCEKEYASKEDLKKCGGCLVATYCDKNCQKKDWKKEHKLVCLKPNSY